MQGKYYPDLDAGNNRIMGIGQGHTCSLPLVIEMVSVTGQKLVEERKREAENYHGINNICMNFSGLCSS